MDFAESIRDRYRSSWDKIRPLIHNPKTSIPIREEKGSISCRSIREDNNINSGFESPKLNYSRSVANCIRGLNEKTTELLKENQILKKDNENLKASYLKEKEELLKTIDEKQKAAWIEENNIKEKIRDLDEFSRNFQIKTNQLEHELENARHECALKDSEIHKLNTILQTREKEIVELKEERMKLKETSKEELDHAKAIITKLQSEIKFQKSDKKKLKEIYAEQQARDIEKETVRWQESTSKIENELIKLRDENSNLKAKITELEDNKASLIEQNAQSEIFVKEIADINEKLLAVIRKKNKSRRPTMSKTNSRVFANNKEFTPDLGEKYSSFPAQRRGDSQIVEASMLENDLKILNDRYKDLLRMGREGKEDMSVLGVELNSVAAALEAKTNHLHSLKSVISDKMS
ncbi:unnamed protein product [Blepharisma stoltei]|uniref:Uncharacterized protein n=1 Tax=Blepharisma stoltei TaxID=1481888 RepID=A0AAU9IJ03_9CILI|nr:unnamed protein product [Blepharisma stoltei]